jgi:hypothetical protein
LESFTIEFIRASHSLIDCFHLAIKTPVGTIIHTGDYKVDETPVIASRSISERCAVMDRKACWRCSLIRRMQLSPGRTPSERAVIPAFEEFSPKPREGSLWRPLRHRSIDCKLCLMWRSNSIGRFACWALDAEECRDCRSAWLSRYP